MKKFLSFFSIKSQKWANNSSTGKSQNDSNLEITPGKLFEQYDQVLFRPGKILERLEKKK